MQWFNVEKVEQPSEEPPPAGKPIDTLYDHVLEKDDVYYYKLFKYGSIIKIYDDMSTYFLARQYVDDLRTKTTILYAEYRLTLTEEAKKIVNELLNVPFECKVERLHEKYHLDYRCIIEHQAYIPKQYTDEIQQAIWDIKVCIEPQEVDVSVMEYITNVIPFNCGPLYPLWERAVECWIDKIAADIGPNHAAATYLIDIIRHRLLEQKYLNSEIIPVYFIY